MPGESTRESPSAQLNVLRIAVAIALLRSKQLPQPHSSSSASSASQADAQRWKGKAKARKQELVTLRQEMRKLEDSKRDAQMDVFPQIISCRCHFFDGCGALNSEQAPSGGGGAGACEHWIDDVLRRRFLRNVRWRERHRRLDGFRKRYCVDEDLCNDDEMEWLTTSVDFLVEWTGNSSPEEDTSAVAATSHQAVDSILVSLKKLLLSNKDGEMIEEIVNNLIACLLQRMDKISIKEGSYAAGSNSQLCAQHLVRKLSNQPFIGQRAMLLVSQRISFLADNLTVTDPFDEAFPQMHDYMFMMMQLVEFLISDNLRNWLNGGSLDHRLFEEWLRSTLQVRKAVEILDNRNSLYLIYLDRIIGEVATQLFDVFFEGNSSLVFRQSFCKKKGKVVHNKFRDL